MKKMLVLLATAMIAGIGAAEFCIPAQDMNYDSEGWGCSKPGGILVAKLGKVVAQGTYASPAAGKYTVWVLTETRNEGWRRAQIKINGASYGKFGDEKVKDYSQPKGYWKKMMMPLEVKTAGDPLKVEIIDAGKGSVRYGGVILTDNPAYDPNKAGGDPREDAETLENAE